MSRAGYLAKNTILFAINSIGTRVIAFIMVPLYTISLTTAEYGTVDLITTIATVLVPIITINIGEAVMRFSLDEDANRAEIVSIGLVFIIVSFLLGSCVVFLKVVFPALEVKTYLVYIFCIVQGVYQTLACNLRGQEKLLHYAVANIVLTFLAAGFNIVFLVLLHMGVNGYFAAYVIAYFFATGYCFVTGNVVASIKKFRINYTLLKDMVKYSIVLVPNSLMWWIMNSSDHIMVTSMISIAANGIYAVSYKLPSILSALSTVFNQAWAYSAIHEDKSDDRESFNNMMYDKLVRFQLLLTIMLMCVIKPFLKVYVEESYYSAWQYTPYLLVGYFFLTMGTFLSTSYTVNKDSKGFLISGSLGALVNIAMNWLLIPRIGIHGAALATCVSYIIVFLYRERDIQKYIIIRVFKRDYVFGYILLLLTACTMAVDSIFGQLLLIIEVLVTAVYNRQFVYDCFLLVSKMVKHRRSD